MLAEMGQCRRTRDGAGGPESGAAAMTLIVVVGILLLAFAMLFGVRISKATDEASGLQAAADAAALAGAQSIVDDAPGQIVSALVNGQQIPGSLGQGRAEDFANRNDATLVSYGYSPSQDRVRVTVRSKDVLESGEREERTAGAKLGLALGPCETPQTPATPTSSSTSSPSSSSSSSSTSSSSSSSSSTTPPPVEDVTDDIQCGGLDIPLTWAWDEAGGWTPDFHVDASLIDDLALEPALAE